MKIGIIGGGISGLGAGVILSQHHDVHLFESDQRLGGHAHTVHVDEGGKSLPMDVGFLVFNELTYPHFTSFLKLLDVKAVDSEMSLSIRSLTENLEWSGTNLNSIFGQRQNLFRPRFYKMLLEILRFHREAEANLVLARRHGWTLKELFIARRFSQELSERYVLPIGAAIWSTPEFGMLNYPADTFLTFFLNHKLLQVNDRPIWKTVPGGSINYVNKAKSLISHVHQGVRVTSVEKHASRIRIKTVSGEEEFDKVILATHAPISLALLKDATEMERQILSQFRTEANEAALHRNASLMPKIKRCWSSWNVMAGAKEKVALTYYLNRLQPIESKLDYFLTLNPQAKNLKEFGRYSFQHPLFTRETIRAQRELSMIQGARGIFFAGAWTRYGFHEDGLLSAVRVAEQIGVRAPWEAGWKAA